VEAELFRLRHLPSHDLFEDAFNGNFLCDVSSLLVMHHCSFSPHSALFSFTVSYMLGSPFFSHTDLLHAPKASIDRELANTKKPSG
jgi:hypothetical protein